MELRKVLYSTIHKKKKSIEQIADEVGCSPSLLYRCANINDLDARFPLERLLPLMRSAGDFSVLKHLASRSGYLLYKLPARIKFQKIADLNKYQSLLTDTFRGVLNFKDGRIRGKDCLSQIDELLTKTIELRRGIENSRQIEIDFKEE